MRDHGRRPTDTRNMTRSTLMRHLTADMTTPASRVRKRGIFDEETPGWRLRWTNNPYAETLVEWVNGTQESDRRRGDEDRALLCETCLTEVEQVLTARGYVVTRAPRCVLVLRRTDR